MSPDHYHDSLRRPGYPACGQGDEAEDHVSDRALARATRADQADDLSLTDVEGPDLGQISAHRLMSGLRPRRGGCSSGSGSAAVSVCPAVRIWAVRWRRQLDLLTGSQQAPNRITNRSHK